MKIVIPMTGYGSRFVQAGYKELKPLIKVQQIPIIEWIVRGMYPNEHDFLFICRKEHLDTIEGMRDELMEIAPSAQIYEIGDWVKKGPVHDVLLAGELIEDDEPCIVNYCDFYMSWDWELFKKDVQKNKPGGVFRVIQDFILICS